MPHDFLGVWITDEEFAHLSPRNVFHRQLQPMDLPCTEHRNRHILFRKRFALQSMPASAVMYISADDYYKLYVNGRFVQQGPTASYHFQYNYNAIDVAPYLQKGENVIAVHTLYQGLINRVWVSGDQRHGLICDLEADGKVIVKSDESFLTRPHSGYAELSTVGYDTQFMEEYDARSPEVGFEKTDFDDSAWAHAQKRLYADYTLAEQKTKMLVYERIAPAKVEKIGNELRIDFGSTYVGYLCATARGRAGDTVTVRCGQELNPDGTVRWKMRCNCAYEDTWILSGGDDVLDWFDYKSFRYVSMTLPEGCEVADLSLTARHYPFALRARMKPSLASDKKLRSIWDLCVHTLEYGIQEVIQDCMDREKGFYLGDACATAFSHMLLTGDDSIVRKTIDDAFASAFISKGLMTCMDCAMMQEIAEYPLMMVYMILWHYRYTGDREYLANNYPKVCALLDEYRASYEKNGLLSDLDRWCVVEWPDNFRDGYDVDITEGKVCHTPHISINAYYLEAIHCANAMAGELGLCPYRDEKPLIAAMRSAFYDEKRHLFKDSNATEHASYIGNLFAYTFRLCPDEASETAILDWVREKNISYASFYSGFAFLCGLVRFGKRDLAEELVRDEGAWLRMLREGATTTFEGWGKDSKWNTSLFHLTISFACIFLMDEDLERLFA